jgi:hypothetical protein
MSGLQPRYRHSKGKRQGLLRSAATALPPRLSPQAQQPAHTMTAAHDTRTPPYGSSTLLPLLKTTETGKKRSKAIIL